MKRFLFIRATRLAQPGVLFCRPNYFRLGISRLVLPPPLPPPRFGMCERCRFTSAAQRLHGRCHLFSHDVLGLSYGRTRNGVTVPKIMARSLCGDADAHERSHGHPSEFTQIKLNERRLGAPAPRSVASSQSRIQIIRAANKSARCSIELYRRSGDARTPLD